eukprot:Gregarina_sp_Poly_1__3601@NODE_2057_length_2750_cov_152_057026_g1327_i0_p1_GENE_NODE_2057_length_2750_cov_152_057026_g1327_i0NODE_2057_length_2750_cov_152_057026_g1327_i0_p1_ORF_typecomplete_len460_score58_58_NODE_2057_length_2750_cov_152_057026_g1327_i0631442
MSLFDPAIFSLVTVYFNVQDRWKLCGLCRRTRNWVRSPEQEKLAMTRCLERCYGTWSSEAAARRTGKESFKDLALDSWIKLELALDFEITHDTYRGPNTFSIGGSTWKRKDLPKLNDISQTLKFLSIDWVRKYEDPNWDVLHKDIAVYVSDSSTSGWLKRATENDYRKVMQDLMNEAPQSRSADLSILQSLKFHRHHAIKGAVAPIASWSAQLEYMVRTKDADEAPCDGCQFRPEEAFVPFYLRLLLLDEDLVRRLIDINDTEMTPQIFLSLPTSELGFVDVDDEDDWECDSEEENQILGGLAQDYSLQVVKSLLQNPAIFETSASDFWKLDNPIGTSSFFTPTYIRKHLFQMENEWYFFQQCCRTLAVHELFYLEEIWRLVFKEKYLRPFDMQSHSTDETVPGTVDIVDAARNGDLGIVELSLLTVNDDRANFFVASGGCLVHKFKAFWYPNHDLICR